MPYKHVWVEPELFLEYKGVRVYRSYDDDDADRPVEYNLYSMSNEERLHRRQIFSLSGKRDALGSPPLFGDFWERLTDGQRIIMMIDHGYFTFKWLDGPEERS